jgi:triphosphoribosyl-dephospho-CoA synthase
MKAGREIAQLVQSVCIQEACAPKPGNVNRRHDFPDTRLEDYLLSAIAVGPAFQDAAQMSVGQIILKAACDTRRAVQSNTNLGMILLLAPLAKACLRAEAPEKIRQELRVILRALTVEDARLAYAAIRQANPGGLGTVPHSDVAEEPMIPLLRAMDLARDRDAVAREYVTDYAITFEIGLPALQRAGSQGASFPDSIVQAFLSILSKVPDTLIARKIGIQAALEASGLAEEVLSKGGILTSQGQAALAAMDAALRDANHSMNPGTTADLTAASLFVFLLEQNDTDNSPLNPTRCLDDRIAGSPAYRKSD